MDFEDYELTVIDYLFHKVFKFCVHYISDICKTEDVSGFPTFKFYRNGKFVEKYDGGRTKPEFIKFMDKQAKGAQEDESPMEVVYEEKDAKKDEL